MKNKKKIFSFNISIVLLFSIIFISSCGGTNKKIEEKVINENIEVEKDIETTNEELINTGSLDIETKKVGELDDDGAMIIKFREDVEILSSQEFSKLEKEYIDNPGNIENTIKYINELLNIGKKFYKEEEYAESSIKIAMNTYNLNFDDETKKEGLSELLRAIGRSNDLLGKDEVTISSYKESLKDYPNNYNSYIDLGNKYKEMGQDIKANEAFKKAEEIIK